MCDTSIIPQHVNRKRIWAVGGQVRDTLLGRPVSGDLDYAVDIHSAAGIASSVAGHWRTSVTEHPATRTYTVDLTKSRGLTVDFATTRIENYPKPGKFPKITQWGVPIGKDLARRDFTINAMAMNLHTEQIVTAKHAVQDLQHGVLRVLHDQSFIDDPLRMLRLVRYAVLLDFWIHPDTKALIDHKLLKTVSSKRIDKETSRWNTSMWKTAELLGILKALHTELI